ncbi:MAG: pentapeptide repeat-containing protein [Acidobacteriota bacterium]|nr:pentapeptide repeat-containing protein [Acidobacteriota bacterium]
MGFADMLESGRQDFLDAVRGLAPESAAAKPPAGGWSILECIEHVVTVEERWLDWLLNGTPAAPRRNRRRELRLFTQVRSRLVPIEAPEVVRPRGRFRTLGEALMAFENVRARSAAVALDRGESLYSVGARHPFFGEVNGGELMQLIDAHARRHADQIREIRDTPPAPPPVRPKAPAAGKSFEFHRDRPDLPGELAPGSFPPGGAESIAIAETLLHDAERRDLQTASLRIEGSVLERVHLAGGQFGNAVWKDVRFAGCDLSNVRTRRLVLTRVEFIDCRLTGFRATSAEWRDVLIENGDAAYAQFEAAQFRSCEFVRCNWREAGLQNADLSGSVFRSCGLSRADLRGTTLRNTDLRGSSLEEAEIGMHNLRGAIVDAPQAMILARLLGVRIL